MLQLNSNTDRASKGWSKEPTHIVFILLLAVSSVLLVACTTDRDGVNDLWVGIDVDGMGYIGQDLPVSATIRTGSPVKHVDIEIDYASGSSWAFVQRYTEGMSGSTDVSFEAVVAVPDTAERGNYKFVLRVTEEDGTTWEEATDLSLDIDTTVPIASSLDVGINAAGNDLHLASELTAPAGIANVVVKITGDSWSDEVVFSNDRIVGKLEYHFHEHVDVEGAPKGEYTVVLTVVDERGRQYRTQGGFAK